MYVSMYILRKYTLWSCLWAHFPLRADVDLHKYTYVRMYLHIPSPRRCGYTCTYTCTYVYVCVGIHTHPLRAGMNIHTCTYMCVYLFTHKRAYLHPSSHRYGCTYTDVYPSVYMCIFLKVVPTLTSLSLHVWICAFTPVCLYAHVYTQLGISKMCFYIQTCVYIYIFTWHMNIDIPHI